MHVAPPTIGQRAAVVARGVAGDDRDPERLARAVERVPELRQPVVVELRRQVAGRRPSIGAGARRSPHPTRGCGPRTTPRAPSRTPGRRSTGSVVSAIATPSATRTTPTSTPVLRRRQDVVVPRAEPPKDDPLEQLRAVAFPVTCSDMSASSSLERARSTTRARAPASPRSGRGGRDGRDHGDAGRSGIDHRRRVARRRSRRSRRWAARVLAEMARTRASPSRHALPASSAVAQTVTPR